jgi:transposase-like protein
VETRVGEIELLIPKKRSGSYFPSFLEPRRCSEIRYERGERLRLMDQTVKREGD